MPSRMVCLVLGSWRQCSVGSSSHRRVRVGPILAESALVFGSIATEDHSAPDRSAGGRGEGVALSHSVSPVQRHGELGDDANVARFDRGDGDLFLAAHHVELADALFLPLFGIEHARIGGERAAKHAEVGQLAHERIGGGLEDERAQARLASCADFLFGVRRRFLAVTGADLGGRRHKGDHGVQQRADAQVARGQRAQHRHDGVLLDGDLQAVPNLIVGQFLAVQVLS